MSHVINRPEAVSPDTRARVLAAVEELGHVRSEPDDGDGTHEHRSVALRPELVVRPSTSTPPS